MYGLCHPGKRLAFSRTPVALPVELLSSLVYGVSGGVAYSLIIRLFSIAELDVTGDQVQFGVRALPSVLGGIKGDAASVDQGIGTTPASIG